GRVIELRAVVDAVTDLDLSKSYDSRAEFGGGEYFLSNRDMAWFVSFYLKNERNDAADPRASPLVSQDLKGLPPAVVVTAGFDPLCDEGRTNPDPLQAAGG